MTHTKQASRDAPPGHNPRDKLWDFRVEAWREQKGYRVRITGMRTGQTFERAEGYRPLWELIRLIGERGL